MKYITFLFFTLVTNSTFCQSKIFIYQFDWVKYDCRPNEVHSTEAYLVASEDESLYFDLNNIKKLAISKDGIGVSAKSKSKAFNYVILKSTDTNKLKFWEQIQNRSYYYEDSTPTIEWEILSDTTTYMDYICQKATGTFSGRKYEAWFAPQIPISNGPDKFGGLPGLIVKLIDSEGKISFNLIGIEEREKTIDSRTFFQGHLVSRKEFKNREQDFFLNRKNYSSWANDKTMKVKIRGKSVTTDELFEDIKNDYLCRNNID